MDEGGQWPCRRLSTAPRARCVPHRHGGLHPDAATACISTSACFRGWVADEVALSTKAGVLLRHAVAVRAPRSPACCPCSARARRSKSWATLSRPLSTRSTMVPIDWPAWATWRVPVSVWATDPAVNRLMSRCPALRQQAHLAGDDREAASLLAGTRRFAGRVERQDVGLERDPVDDRIDLADAARAALDRCHRVDDWLDDATAGATAPTRRPRPLAPRRRFRPSCARWSSAARRQRPSAAGCWPAIRFARKSRHGRRRCRGRAVTSPAVSRTPATT